MALAPKFRLQIFTFCRKREFGSGGRAAAEECVRDRRKRLQRLPQEWRMILGAPQRVLS
jgi:hypothetical protein